MTDKKQKKITLVSPKATFRYPKLNAPDFGTEQYKKEGGEYSVQLVMDAEAARPFIEKLTPLHEAAVQEGQVKFDNLNVAQRKKLGTLKVQPLFMEEYDKETEEPTGNLIFKFASKASGVGKDGKSWSRKPTVFDAKGQAITKLPDIWGGTVGKVSFTPNPYFIAGQGLAGLKLYLSAVQIIELRSGGGTADSFGFGEEEGFEYEETSTPAEKEGFGAAEDDGEEDF
jgi:hypothetical protein